MRIGLVSDKYTQLGISNEIKCVSLTPYNYKLVLRLYKLDLIFVESAWCGPQNSWKYKIASYPGYKKRNNFTLIRLINEAKNRAIPTIFWNKEDGVHFDRFSESAKHFDHILTVDSNSVEKYKLLADFKSVNTMTFPVHQKFHFFEGFNFKTVKANFCGSYNSSIHKERKESQEMIFSAASKTIGLDIYDRNSRRSNSIYRFPEFDNTRVFPVQKYRETANIYKSYYASININTITDSPSMYSRRLIEILACGGIAVTNAALSLDANLKDFCHIVSSYDEAYALFERLKFGPSSNDLEKAASAVEYVSNNHTWKNRIDQIVSIIGY